MRYDLWRQDPRQYLGGAQTKGEALAWARHVALRDARSVIVRTPSGMTVTTITPRGARNAATRAQSRSR